MIITKNYLLQNLAKGFGNFTNAVRGNIALSFAIMGATLVAFFGSAVELARVNSSKSELQAIADSLALAVKKEEIKHTREGESIARARAETFGQAYFYGLVPSATSGIANLQPVISWTEDGSAKVSISGRLDTYLTGILGVNYVNVQALGSASAGASKNIEVAILLDNTGSMFAKDSRTTTRFTLMRNSAKSFVNTMFDVVFFVCLCLWINL